MAELHAEPITFVEAVDAWSSCLAQTVVRRYSSGLRSTGTKPPNLCGQWQGVSGQRILAGPPATPFERVIPKVDFGADALYLYASSRRLDRRTEATAHRGNGFSS